MNIESMTETGVRSQTRIVSLRTEPFQTPLFQPFVTSRGMATEARAVAVWLQLANGQTARGEAVPVQYVTGETVETVQETIARVGPELVGQSAARYQPLLKTVRRQTPNAPSARCALEMAILRAWSQVWELPLHQLWGGAQDSVESDLTIPLVSNAEELAARAWERGVRVFKIKVGEKDVTADYDRVAAVRRAAPEARIRLDANQAFTPEDAVIFVSRLLDEGAQLELLEQPTRADDVEGLAWVAARSPVPVFADESVRTPADALRLIATTPVQGFNLKINKNGIGGVLEMIPIARAAGRRLMLGCMLETRYSIAVSLALACGTGAFDHLDLDSHLLLNEPGENPCFRLDGPRMILPK
jgi:L-alanine-DL-glutamate epimerase-like enolase superfamily enzyme